ncbi:MAG: hypothetical protein SH848_17075 [Saprospiraceae bacterium]|nr:hypothetical protein [Saprospiraceae bacterium]MDZ4705642.1 hypothetical protein [Saprospiraceae bacterium]
MIRVFFSLLCLLFFAPKDAICQVFSSSINLEDTTQRHLIITKRGDRIIGRIQKIEGTTVSFIMTTGNVITYPFQEIEWVGLQEEKSADSKRSKGYPSELPRLRITPERNGCENLLFSSSAFNYQKGTGEYRNLEILINIVDVGLSDNISVGGGMAIPFVFIARLKATIDYNEIIHLGAGVNNFIPISEELFGSPFTHFYGVVTLGKPKAYLNATLGYGFTWGGSSLDFPGDRETVPLVATFGGSITVADRFRFIIDVMYLKGEGLDEVIPSFSMGWLGRMSRFELGLFSSLVGTEFSAFPVLAYARRF